MPEKTCYYAGDIFDKSGMKVVANYADGTTKEVYDYTVNKTALEIADKTIVVSYLEKTAIVNGTVVKSEKVVIDTVNGDSAVKDVLQKNDEIIGIKIGDIETSITRNYQFIDVMLNARVGSEITIKFKRGGEEKSATFTVPESCLTEY